MAKEREGWMCDTCHQPIFKAEDGWIEWKTAIGGTGETRATTGLRLVHHKPASPLKGEHGCQYNERKFERGTIISDQSLEGFLGDSGIMHLTELLSEGFEPAEEVLEMIKRLHVKGYEDARPHFAKAISEGVIEPNRKPGYYFPSQIERVLEWMDEHDY
jgi:hypothetical protein